MQRIPSTSLHHIASFLKPSTAITLSTVDRKLHESVNILVFGPFATERKTTDLCCEMCRGFVANEKIRDLKVCVACYHLNIKLCRVCDKNYPPDDGKQRNLENGKVESSMWVCKFCDDLYNTYDLAKTVQLLRKKFVSKTSATASALAILIINNVQISTSKLSYMRPSLDANRSANRSATWNDGVLTVTHNDGLVVKTELDISLLKMVINRYRDR